MRPCAHIARYYQKRILPANVQHVRLFQACTILQVCNSTVTKLCQHNTPEL